MFLTYSIKAFLSVELISCCITNSLILIKEKNLKLFSQKEFVLGFCWWEL